MNLLKEKKSIEEKISLGNATDIEKKRLMKINNAITLGKDSITDDKPKTTIVKTKKKK